MVRPRWHDALIVSAIIALLAVGIWAMWWDDVRRLLHLAPAEGTSSPTTPATPGGQT